MVPQILEENLCIRLKFFLVMMLLVLYVVLPLRGKKGLQRFFTAMLPLRGRLRDFMPRSLLQQLTYPGFILLQQYLVHMAEADVLWVAAVVDSEAAITVEDVNLPG
jgi:hypothetical protein